MEQSHLAYQQPINPYLSSDGDNGMVSSQPSGNYKSNNPILSHTGRDSRDHQHRHHPLSCDNTFPPQQQQQQQDFNTNNPYRSQQNIINNSFGGSAGTDHGEGISMNGVGSNLYSTQFPKSEDLSRGLNDWRNIQHVVRLTFKSVCESVDALSLQVRQQQEYIRRLETTLADQERLIKERVTRAEVAMEISRAMRDVHKAMESMASRADMNTLLEKKADREEVTTKLHSKASAADMKKTMEQKADASDVNAMFDIHARELDVLKKQIKIKANSFEVAEELTKKANISDVQEALATKANADDVHESLKAKIDSKKFYRELSLKADKSAMEGELELKANAAEVNGCLMSKADVSLLNRSLLEKIDKGEFYDQIDMKLSELKRHVDSTVLETEERSNNMMRSIVGKSAQESIAKFEECMNQLQNAKRELTMGLKTKTSNKQMVDLLKTKVDADAFNTQLELKANVEDVRDALTSKANVEDYNQLRTAMESKADLTEVREMIDDKVSQEDFVQLTKNVDRKASKDSVIQALRKKVNNKELKSMCEKLFGVDQIQRDLALKVSVKDLIPLLEEKVSIRDMQLETDQILAEMRRRIDIEEYQKAWQDQSVINEALLSQNTVARWIWKSGKLKSGHGVPWNVQVVNTNPENFVWEKDRVNIITVQPGLYEISFGFYSKKKPTIQLHVNGEPVLSAVNSSSYVVHHSSGRLASIANHSAGNVTGLTLLDFIALPERARVAISYSGDEKAEGFMSLRKL